MRITPDQSAQLDTRIAQQLEHGPHSAAELVTILNVGRHVLQRRLDRLHDAGAVHIRDNPTSKLPCPPRLWAIGLGPKGDTGAGAVPQRVFTKDGPICNRRDPLVAALFGPPSNAPRCTDCRATEGSTHAPGCALARFV